MVAISAWLRYVTNKFEYSVSVARTSYVRGQITDKEVLDTLWKNFLVGRLTFLHWNKGEAMEPTIGAKGGPLLVRRIPDPAPTRVHVGDVVVIKDPEDSANFLVRRLAAIEGYEMASKDEDDEPFVLQRDHCWVVADNDKLKPKEAYDSRTFGPITMANVVGRAIYYLRNDVDHGPVKNSHFSTTQDSPVLEMELDVDEMIKMNKE